MVIASISFNNLITPSVSMYQYVDMKDKDVNRCILYRDFSMWLFCHHGCHEVLHDYVATANREITSVIEKLYTDIYYLTEVTKVIENGGSYHPSTKIHVIGNILEKITDHEHEIKILEKTKNHVNSIYTDIQCEFNVILME